MTLAHRLSARAVIESRSSTRDAAGQPALSWSTVASVWAQIKPINGRAFFAAAAVQSEVKTEIVIRARTDVTPAMRLTIGGRIYDIEAVLPQRGGRELLLICAEGVHHG
jgi:SPP1 family predicted phage head-tail adaptor